MEKNKEFNKEQQLFLASVNDKLEQIKVLFESYNLTLKVSITPKAEESDFDRSKSRY